MCLEMMCCPDHREDGTLYMAHASRNLSKTQNVLDSKTLVRTVSDIKLKAYTYIEFWVSMKGKYFVVTPAYKKDPPNDSCY